MCPNNMSIDYRKNIHLFLNELMASDAMDLIYSLEISDLNNLNMLDDLLLDLLMERLHT